MKKLMLLAGLAAGLLATAAFAADAPDTNATAAATNDAAAPATDQAPPPDATPQPADQTPQPAVTPDQTAPTAVPAAPVPMPAATAPAPAAPMIAVRTRPLAPGEKGLIMNFKDVELQQVLDYMSKVAGFIIHTKVDGVSGTVTVWNDQPMSKEEAVLLLKKVLAEHGYTVVQDGRVLTVMTTLEGKKNTAVGSGNDPDTVENNSDMRTQIIPVGTLNVVQLVKELQPLASTDAQLTADEAANSVMITDTQSGIRHLMEVIKALDSVNSNSSTVKVYKLKYADAKATAALIKEVFPNPDTGPGGGTVATHSPEWEEAVVAVAAVVVALAAAAAAIPLPRSWAVTPAARAMATPPRPRSTPRRTTTATL